MFHDKPRSILAVLPVLVLAVFAGSFLNANPSKPPGVEPPIAGPNKLLFYRADHLTLIDPDGKNEKELSKESSEFRLHDAKLSPDGKVLAVLYPPSWKPHVRGIEAKAPGTVLAVECHSFVWSTDGTEIAYSWEAGEGDEPSATHGIVNVNTKKTSPLRLPESH